MEIKIIKVDKDPIRTIGLIAGVSHGKFDPEEPYEKCLKRVQTCARLGHDSVFEHVSFTAYIKGISRSCSHQLVRHRIGSYNQISQRYVKIDTDSDWYVMPKAFEQNSTVEYLENQFAESMEDCADMYNLALRNGVKPEDARFLLPEATKTEIVMTMNARSYFNFLDLRADNHAQWEIRELAKELFYQLDSVWNELHDLWLERQDD